VSLVPKWSGSDTALPIHEFFDIIEGSGKIGNWTEADQIQVCALKLTDPARAYYGATPELRDPAITWQEFKAHFLKRFRDVRGDQYHFSQLQMARQRKDETPTEFLDRCRLLARRTVPCTTDPVLQRVYNEQAERMLLSAFIHGLSSTPGKMVRFSMPATAEEALRIAVTVSQAEIQEARNNAFYLDSEVAEISPAGRMREPAVHHTGAKSVANNGDPRRKSGQASQRRPDKRESTRNAQSADTVQCYECRGYGHYARDCANRSQRRVDNRAAGDNGNKTGKGKASEPTSRDRAKGGDRRRANKQSLN
jgi:hypothetical protein